MKIKRFDSIEYNVINCSVHGGYYPAGEESKRAILLMEEGVFEKNPQKNWYKNGWSLTEYGKEYYKSFMKKVQKKHGHVWMTHHENDTSTKNDTYGKSIDIFAYSEGYHNGPKCKKCGFEFCQHCTNEIEIPVCGG